MIEWNQFDKIYCIHYIPYKERYNDIQKELSRIGILNNKFFQWYYTIDSKLYDDLYDSLIDHKIIFQNNIEDIYKGKSIIGNFKSNRTFNLAINKLNLMIQAKEFGYEKILVLEDDICFLKDLTKISNYINNMPLDFDIVNFDYWFRDINDLYSLRHIYKNEIYYKLNTSKIAFNFSCIAFSKAGIDNYVNNQMNILKSSDYYVNCQRTFPGSKLNIYIPDKNLCIQNMKYINANNNNNINKNKLNYNQSVEWTYQKICLDTSNYQEV